MSKEYGFKIYGTTEEVDIANIVWDQEGRRNLDIEHVEELRQSISKQGLINSVTVFHEDGSPTYRLLAGLHRLHACIALQMTRIPARIYSHTLTDFELKCIEVYENLHRKELSDVERAQQTAQLHELMQRIHGPKLKTSPAGHSLRDTAQMLGRSVGSVHRDIKIADAAKSMPELNLEGHKNSTLALRTVERLKGVLQAQMAAATTHTIAEGDPRKQLIDSYRLGDFFDNTLESGTFGFIECDPPYALDIKKFRDAQDKQRLLGDYNHIDLEKYPSFLVHLANECYRLASANSWMILWYVPSSYQLCIDTLASAGWHVWPVPVIWKKGNSPGQSQAPDSNLGNAYEPFLYAHKGSPKLRIKGRSNIFDYPGVNPASRIHPTERPMELSRDILNTFSWEHIPVLVPFAGSGNTIMSAYDLRMPSVGYDLSEHFRNSFVERVLSGRGGKV